MQRRIISLALTLCLILTACGGKEEDSRGQATLLGGAAGLEEEETLLTVGGREVPAWRYLYWLAYTCDRIQKQYDQAGLTLDWNAPVTGGTLADYARDQALADTALYATVENWAEEYGAAADAEEEPNASMPKLGLTEEQMAELEGVGALYAALYTLYCTEGSELSPEKDALRLFARERGCITADRILIPFGEDRQAAQQRAAEVFSQLNGGLDQAAEFTALAAAGADTAGPRTWILGDGTLDAGLEEAAAALEEGQCSGILESPEGFSILRRLETDTAPVREDYFDHLLQSAAKNAAVQTTEAYETLDVPGFFQELERLRAEKEA